MKLRSLLISGAVLVLSACDGGTPAPPPVESPKAPVTMEGAAPVTDLERIRANILELSSDEFSGREPMSEGERLTLDFIETQFRSIGLQPMFGDSYRQPVSLAAITADPATAQMTFHMKGKDRIVANGDEMVLNTMRVVPESKVTGSEVVFVGYGVVAPDFGWNDYADVDVKGKTVLILINDPGSATGDETLFKGKAMTYYGRWTYKYEEAARQGAAAAVIIHDTVPAAYGWEVVRNSRIGPQFHLASPDDNMSRLPLQSWIQKSVAEELVSAAGHDLASLVEQASQPEFRAIPLGSTMDASVQNEIERNQSFNVGGVLPGRERPDELFIYMGHWDHLGADPSVPEGEDGIYNGAVDNASGIAALLELARSFAALPHAPERSVGFLAVTAEESGLLGSAYYAENPAVPAGQTVGGINLDAMHVYGPTRDVVVVGYGSSELEDVLKQKAADQDRVVEPEEHPEHGSYYRSDHFSLAKKGVPMLYAESGSDHVELGPEYVETKSQEYLKNRYHSPRDEVTDDWDLRGLAQDIELWFAIGLDIADSDRWPNWYEGNEFRAIRDQSRNPAGSPDPAADPTSPPQSVKQ